MPLPNYYLLKNPQNILPGKGNVVFFLLGVLNLKQIVSRYLLLGFQGLGSRG